MKSSRNFTAMQIKAGAVLAVAMVLLFSAMVLFPTRGVNPFSSKIKLYAYYPNVSGLRASSPVWLSGVEVGTITQVRLVPGSEPLQVRVAMRVQRWTLSYLKTDSRALIKGMGLLGDMFIELTPGSAGQPLHDGSVVVGEVPKQAQDEINRALGSADMLLKSLTKMTEDLMNGQGTLGKLIRDQQLYTELVAAIHSAQTTLAALNSDEGTAGLLVNDPTLYREMVASFQNIRGLAGDLQQAEQKVISPETRETIDKTAKTVSQLVDWAGNLQQKLQKIRFELLFGVDKLESNLVAGHAEVMIWPNDQRYYMAGVHQITDLYGVEKDKTTFHGDLAWRILDSPFFIRGGVIRNEYFNVGLDLRSRDYKFRLLADAYRLQFNPLQLDVSAGYKVLDGIELSVGAEDLFRRPFFKAGLTVYYIDPDLLNVYIHTLGI